MAHGGRMSSHGPWRHDPWWVMGMGHGGLMRRLRRASVGSCAGAVLSCAPGRRVRTCDMRRRARARARPALPCAANVRRPPPRRPPRRCGAHRRCTRPCIDDILS
eukprot:1960605-Prymnesium_polylepis.1